MESGGSCELFVRRKYSTVVSIVLESWTAIDSPSPKHTSAQLASWIRGLGAQADDEEITENAEA